MGIIKRISVFAMVTNPALMLCAMFMPWGATSNVFGGWAFLPALALLLAVPVMIVGYNLKKPVWGRNICAFGLLMSLFGILCTVGGLYFNENGAWRLQNLKPLQTAENLVFTWSDDEGGRQELDVADSERLLALWQQVKYCNHSEKISLSPVEYYELCRQRDLQTELPDGSRMYVIVKPPYYLTSVGWRSTMEDYAAGRITEFNGYAYTAADPELCQQLADLYAELEAKYYPTYASLTTAEMMADKK